MALAFLLGFASAPVAAQYDPDEMPEPERRVVSERLGDRGIFGRRGAMARPLAEQEARARDLMAEANQARDAGRTTAAVRLYRRLARNYPAASYAPHALFNAGKLEFERGRYRQAFDYYQSLLRGYPDFPDFNIIVGDQFELASRLMDKRRRFLIFRWSDYDNAIQFFEQLIANAPFSDYAPLALMNLAQIHHGRGDYAEAVDALDRLINFYPNSMLTPDAYLKLAEIYASMVRGPAYDQGATREALSYYDDFLILFPDSPQVARGEQGRDEMREVLARSKFDIGRYYFRFRRNYEASRIFFNEAITVSPESPSSIRARQYLDQIEAMPPPQPAAERPARRGFNPFFWRRAEPAVPNIEPVEPPLATDYSRGDRPTVATDAISASKVPEERRGWLSRLWPFGRRDETPPPPPTDEPASPEAPTRP